MEYYCTRNTSHAARRRLLALSPSSRAVSVVWTECARGLTTSLCAVGRGILCVRGSRPWQWDGQKTVDEVCDFPAQAGATVVPGTDLPRWRRRHPYPAATSCRKNIPNRSGHNTPWCGGALSYGMYFVYPLKSYKCTLRCTVVILKGYLSRW
jgi:hypothetical protein